MKQQLFCFEIHKVDCSVTFKKNTIQYYILRKHIVVTVRYHFTVGLTCCYFCVIFNSLKFPGNIVICKLKIQLKEKRYSKREFPESQDVMFYPSIYSPNLLFFCDLYEGWNPY